MTSSVDKQWFVEKYEGMGLSLRKLSGKVGMQPSAFSRTLSGKRKMTISEIVKIATALEVQPAEVLAHLNPAVSAPAAAPEHQSNIKPTRISDHPGFGFMKGLIKIEEGFDVTGPFTDEPWDEGYLGDDRRK